MTGSPLLIYGDAPDQFTGLARISRDLALISSTLPEFRTATFGRGAIGSSRFPWPQYTFNDMGDQWGEHKIQQVWRDFTRGEGGSGQQQQQILTVWDASRLLWFAGLAATGNPELDVFLGDNRTFQRWGYFMVDGTGPDGRTLPYESREVLRRYDRVVVASEWAAGVVRASGVDCEWIPHPIDGERFHYARFGPNPLREQLGIADRIVVGCCMTNQARKDWPTAFATAAILSKIYHSRFLFWVHTDSAAFTPGAYWNLHALAADFTLPPECLRITLTGTHTDAMMAAFYNSCDATMLCSGGEGFGYPIAESLACGCPAITQDWGAGAELTQPEWRVPVHSFKLETSHNILRAVHSPYPWANALEQVIEKGKMEGEEWRREIADSMKHLHIKSLKKVWKRYLLEGLR